MAMPALITVDGVAWPEPSTYDANTATIVDSGRNVQGRVIGAVVRHDVAKIEVSWRYLTAEQWSQVIRPFTEKFYVTVTFFNQTTAMNRRWMVEGQHTDIPKATFGDPMGNSRFSDRWIEDGSYLKLKNVRLTYKIPYSNSWLLGLKVWGEANNVFTLTKYLGTDPEMSSRNSSYYRGVDNGQIPFGRSFNVGVSINL